MQYTSFCAMPHRVVRASRTNVAQLVKPHHSSFSTRALLRRDYGGGDGNPAAERPMEQGPNSAQEKEHPGPPPPDVSGSGAKGTSQNPGPKINPDNKPFDKSDEVAKHNRELDQAQTSHSKETFNEKDKVKQGFWKGEGDQ